MIKSTNTYKGITSRDGWECQEYHVVLRNGTRRLSTVFYVGMGWTDQPSAADVLSSLLADAQSIRWDDVDAWIEEYGYEINSLADAHKHEATYRQIERQTKKLQQFLGDAYDEAIDDDTEEWSAKHAESRRVHA